jgi:hypothetical protein
MQTMLLICYGLFIFLLHEAQKTKTILFCLKYEQTTYFPKNIVLKV